MIAERMEAMCKTDRRNRSQSCKGAAFASILFGMLLQMVMPVFAEENVIGPSGKGYPASRWEKLTDNVLEYDEIQDRVHEFNTNFNSTWETLDQTRDDLRGYVLDLESAQFKVKNLEDAAKEAVKNGNEEAKQDLGNYQVILNGMQMGKISMPSFGSLISNFRTNAEKVLEDMIPNGQKKQLENGERQVVMGVQQLMIAYDDLLKKKHQLEIMASMYEKQYQYVINKQKQEMATEKDVLEAQANCLNAASLLASMESGLLQMKPSLCTLTGYPADADLIIAEIPPVDLTEIDRLDPTGEDLRKAIGSNQTLIAQRTSAKGGTTSGVEVRLKYIEEGEEKMKIKMDSLYHDILECRTAYEGALLGLEAAKKDREKYRRMKELGYMSDADFLGTEISYCSKETEYHSADTALRLAIANYDWAVKGLTAID